MYHVLVLVFFQQRHSQSRDDTPFHIQDCCWLTVLRVEFHVIHTLNHNLQRISKRKCMKCKLIEWSDRWHELHTDISDFHWVTYLSISAAKAPELGAGRNTGLPSGSMSTTSLRLQPLVRTMKLQVWGTSISTCRRGWFFKILLSENNRRKSDDQWRLPMIFLIPCKRPWVHS